MSDAASRAAGLRGLKPLLFCGRAESSQARKIKLRGLLRPLQDGLRIRPWRERRQAEDGADRRERAAMNRRSAEPFKSGHMLADGITLVLRKAVSRMFR